ncbi:lipopolysaccharide biosynthesis protein [Bifidobacterium pullorum]|nr:MATE family efflux transporter [Bifidobacterium pullorum]
MIANVIAFGVQFGINFVLTPYIIKTLGSEAYGFVPLANNFIGYVNILTVALNSMSSRFLTIEINRGNTRQAQVYFNSVLMANTVMAAILAVPSVLLVAFAGRVMNVPEGLLQDVQLTFAYALLGMEISLVLSVFGDVFYVKNRLDLSAKRNIESNVLRAVILVGLFAIFRPRIWFITGTMLIVTIYLSCANIHYTHKLTPEFKIDRTKFSGKTVRTLLSAGVWNSVNQLSMVLLTTLDIYLANIFIGAQASGEYSLVKTVPNFIQSLVGVLVGVFIPQFTISYAKRQKRQLLDQVDFSIKVMGYVMMLPIGFLLVFGEDFFRVWVPSQNSQLLQQLSILTILPMVVTCSINTIFNVYTVTSKLKVPALVLLFTGIGNTLAVIVLLRFTDLGLLAIPLVSFAIGLIRNLTFTPVYAAHCLGVRNGTFYKAIARGCGCVVIMVLCCLVYHSLFRTDSWPTLILAAAVCSVIAGAMNLFLAFGKADRQMLWRLVASKVIRRS